MDVGWNWRWGRGKLWGENLGFPEIFFRGRGGEGKVEERITFFWRQTALEKGESREWSGWRRGIAFPLLPFPNRRGHLVFIFKRTWKTKVNLDSMHHLISYFFNKSLLYPQLESRKRMIPSDFTFRLSSIKHQRRHHTTTNYIVEFKRII